MQAVLLGAEAITLVPIDNAPGAVVSTHMLIAARVDDAMERHSVSVVTDGTARTIPIAPRAGGRGSSVNGGEMLCVALATCYCNDLYREAARRGIAVVRVAVEANAEFGGPGEPARTLRYRADVAAHADESAIRTLMLDTDRVAEIQNTLRQGMPVLFEPGRAERAA